MRSQKTYLLALTAFFAALIIICSYIVLPLPFSPVPVTAHTLAIALAGLILPRRQSFEAVGIYLLLGIALGIVSFGPAVGYYVGFLLTSLLVPTLRGSKTHLIRYFLVAVVAALVTELCGTVGMMAIQSLSFKAALLSGFVVFLPGDLAKAVLAAVIAVPVKKATGRILTTG